MYSMCVFALAIVIFDVSAIVLPKNTTNTAPDLDRAALDELSILPDSNDAIVNFLRGLFNAGHVASQLTVNRVKDELEKRKRLIGEIKNVLIPTSRQP
ncbi:hypothetical protein MTP99_004318 [Tenebrio molitor]|nr:hypothetical protein MTP99_004318 [Tenebrio molitor]